MVEEYEIDTAAVEALNSIEKRAAVETGREQENIQVTGQISAKAALLSKVCTSGVVTAFYPGASAVPCETPSDAWSDLFL